MDDDPALSETPLAIDPAMVHYRQTGQIAVDFKKVSALAVDADDRIYVAGDKSLCRFSPQGKLEMRIALSYEPTCLTVANRQHLAPGRIYVGFVDHVEVYEADGAKAAIWQGLGEHARFTSISSSEQYIFIADAGQNVVQRFDWTGKLLESFGESSPGHFTSTVNGANAPFDLVVGLDDLVYVVNRRDHRVEGYSFEGEMERHWGQGSPAVEDFAGPSNPAHLALTGGWSFRDRRGSSVAGQGLLAVGRVRRAWCADPKEPVRWSACGRPSTADPRSRWPGPLRAGVRSEEAARGGRRGRTTLPPSIPPARMIAANRHRRPARAGRKRGFSRPSAEP